MPGHESGGVGNMWYSFDYGLVHFVAISSETDFPSSPEYSFLQETDGKTDKPTEQQTYVTDAGPFGYIKGSYESNEAYEQWQWLKNDLKSVDRSKTPWIICMGHRPMWSSQVDSYQRDVRRAFQALMVEHGVDMYLAGHIHWYERLYPLERNGDIDEDSIVNKNTYKTNPGKSMTHIINGMAGNIESHSELDGDPRLNITAVLDKTHYGFSKLTVHSKTKLTWQMVRGDGQGIRDELTLVKG
jgi:acid phosphatase